MNKASADEVGGGGGIGVRVGVEGGPFAPGRFSETPQQTEANKRNGGSGGGRMGVVSISCRRWMNRVAMSRLHSR